MAGRVDDSSSSTLDKAKLAQTGSVFHVMMHM